jgi:Zinc finger, C3HC4 type (RING finger)
MSSFESNSNRTVAFVDERELNRLFPGVPPNTQVRIIGPVGLHEEIEIPFDLENEYTEMDDRIPSPVPIIRNGADESETKSIIEHKESDPQVRGPFAPAQPQPSTSFSEAQFLESITAMIDKIISSDVKQWGGNPDVSVTMFGPGRHQGLKQVTLKNIVFEVNKLIINRVIISQIHSLSNNEDKFSAAISYVRSNKNLTTGGPAWTIDHSGKTVAEAITKTYENLKALKKCEWCTGVWDGRMNDQCIICLFSDYFTRENEKIECPICRTSTRDFTTLDCNHRMCYQCLFKIVRPKKCPLCRLEIE